MTANEAYAVRARAKEDWKIAQKMHKSAPNSADLAAQYEAARLAYLNADRVWRSFMERPIAGNGIGSGMIIVNSD